MFWGREGASSVTPFGILRSSGGLRPGFSRGLGTRARGVDSMGYNRRATSTQRPYESNGRSTHRHGIRVRVLQS